MSSDLPVLVESLRDVYRIEREIGAGGMATVYLAHDLKHDRDVAIKVLHRDLAFALGADRFLSEIRTTAKLQHPHILPLLDSGAAGGLLYYVMPLVTGESLRARLERERQLPIDDAIRLTREVASALDYAHRQGVIHRDIKPENILLHDGSAVVADFGIALAVESAGGERMTQTGMSLGTPQYMSPEQAMGERAINAKSDIYSLGAVSYEMLSGEPPFTGATVQAVIAKVMTSLPEPVTTTRRNVTPNVAAAVHRALEKLPADRFATAADFATALVSATFVSTPIVTAARGRSPMRYATHAAVALAFLAVAGLAWTHFSERAPVQPSLRYMIPMGTQTTVGRSGEFAISPDGMIVAYVARDTGESSSIRIRRLNQLSATVVPGTSDATAVFWSPDSKTIGFFTESSLQRVDLDGGKPTAVCDCGSVMASGAWLAEDVILFSNRTGPILRVSAHGGTPVAVTTLDTASVQLAHYWPSALPDGKHFLFYAEGNRVKTGAKSGTYVGSIDGGGARWVFDQSAQFAAPDHLVFSDNGDVKAVPFDAKTFRVTGDPVSIISGESVRSLSVSAVGSMIYKTTASTLIATSRGSLELLDRSGKTIRVLGAGKAGDYAYFAPRLSPDGKTVAFEHHLNLGGGDLYTADVATGNTVRQTFDMKNHSSFPAWAPDGKRLAYSSTRSGGGDVFVKSIDAQDDKLFVPSTTGNTTPSDWSSDGTTLFFDRIDLKTHFDVWAMPVNGGAPKQILASPANEMQATLSPDGRWIAYASDEDGGRYDVYVRPYPSLSQQWKVSANGGEAPRWRRDGKELFFLSQSDRGSAIMAAPVDGGASFKAGPPVELFRKALFTTDGFLRSVVNYDVTPDGRSFVAIATTGEGTTTSALGVFVNWPRAIAKR